MPVTGSSQLDYVEMFPGLASPPSNAAGNRNALGPTSSVSLSTAAYKDFPLCSIQKQDITRLGGYGRRQVREFFISGWVPSVDMEGS